MSPAADIAARVVHLGQNHAVAREAVAAAMLIIRERQTHMLDVIEQTLTEGK